MVRPTPTALDASRESWEVDANANLRMLDGRAPVPLGKSYANDGALDAETASNFDGCVAAVKSTVQGQTLAVSNGSEFVRVARRGAGSTHGAITELFCEETEIDLSITDTIVGWLQPGRVFLATTLRVTEAIVGPTDFDVYLTDPSNTLKAAVAVAAGTTLQPPDYDAFPWPFAHYVGATGDLQFVPNGGAFVSGKVRVAIYYYRCTAPTS